MHRVAPAPPLLVGLREEVLPLVVDGRSSPETSHDVSLHVVCPDELHHGQFASGPVHHTPAVSAVGPHVPHEKPLVPGVHDICPAATPRAQHDSLGVIRGQFPRPCVQRHRPNDLSVPRQQVNRHCPLNNLNFPALDLVHEASLHGPSLDPAAALHALPDTLMPVVVPRTILFLVNLKTPTLKLPDYGRELLSDNVLVKGSFLPAPPRAAAHVPLHELHAGRSTGNVAHRVDLTGIMADPESTPAPVDRFLQHDNILGEITSLNRGHATRGPGSDHQQLSFYNIQWTIRQYFH